MSKKKHFVSTIHNIDARKIDEVIDKPIVDVTITSPPYFDLKDYGYKNQIGYGQAYDDYLSDLKLVFDKVYKSTKATGTLWVIIDTFKKNGEVTTLPFDFASKIKEVGWKLQEIIIWQKDRTVPWAHKGQMRNLFEYILLFSKTTEYKFFIDEVRDQQTLKKWWVKYPERYNPKGKTPDGVWYYEIPTQGSWGDGYIKHFCPLPEEMVAQILKLTTKENDLVMDPFAGSGAVLSKADNMKRQYVGFELNKSYIKMFNNYLTKTGRKKRINYETESKSKLTRDKFEVLILNLRALKYAKVINQKLNQGNIISKIIVDQTSNVPKKDNALIVVNYTILINSRSVIKKLTTELNTITSVAPLSKYGIESKFLLITDRKRFDQLLKSKKLYTYTNKVTHKYNRCVASVSIDLLNDNEIIVSKIAVDLNENDYE